MRKELKVVGHEPLNLSHAQPAGSDS